MTTKILRGGSGNFAVNPECAAEAGSKDGKLSGGNFRNDPARAREAGRKGGQVSRRGKVNSPSSTG
ncbi:general stress protein [Pantoea sp. S18]|uniref:general stress protein n=1 Tax=Pantoea sp. S18 TaxID=3019892 RepID=UPI002B1F9A19|nr:general stress protein [Pantoea sp. S18]MEA5105653.1 general stress protein [Pantoea sp. S18]